MMCDLHQNLWRWTAVAALLVQGCTMIPKYSRPGLPVSSHFPGANDVFHGPAASELGWRSFFHDDCLKKLIELALSNNRDLRVAILNVEQSQAQFNITRSASFPTIDAGGSFSHSYANNLTFNQWNANIGTTAYEVDIFGRVRSMNKQALEKYFATEEAKRSAQISLVAAVATQYFTLRQAEEQLKLARETLAAVQSSYHLNKSTFNAGETNKLDLLTAEGQVQTADISVITYERRISQIQNTLVLLVGCPLPSVLPKQQPFDRVNLLASIPSGLPSELVLRRADILEAEHTLKAANANIGVARAAFFPAIQFTSSIGTTSAEFSKLFGAGTGLWSFSPNVTLPIFTGGQNIADLKSAKVSTRIEVANYERSIQTAFREVADALIATASYKKQLKAQAALIEAQQKRYNLATVRYRQGEDSYLNVLSAQQDLYTAQQGRLEAQLYELSSQISLYKALGGGWK